VVERCATSPIRSITLLRARDRARTARAQLASGMSERTVREPLEREAEVPAAIYRVEERIRIVPDEQPRLRLAVIVVKHMRCRI